MIYNNTDSRLNVYQQNAWKTVSTDSAEWKFDPATSRINFLKPYLINDTIYFDTVRHKFLFADKATYTNSMGQDFQAVDYGGKYTFKATASKSADSISSNANTLSVFYEVNNASNQYTDGYTGIFGVTAVNPTALQKPTIYGINNTTLYAGQGIHNRWQ